MKMKLIEHLEFKRRQLKITKPKNLSLPNHPENKIMRTRIQLTYLSLTKPWTLMTTLLTLKKPQKKLKC